MADIDTLSIGISANDNASKSIDNLVRSLQRLKSATNIGDAVSVKNLSMSLKGLANIDGANIKNIASGVNSLSNAMTKLSNNSSSADFSRIKDGIKQLSSVNVPNMDNLKNLANSISKLGGKNVQNAVTVIPKVTKSLNDMIKTLSSAPNVSGNVVKLTQAMAQLSNVSRGASGGMRTMANNSMQSGIKNIFSNISAGTTKANTGMKSLAYYFGKFYANFWILRRAIGLIGGAINYASDLVEVQNVVDNTFRSSAGAVDDLSKNAIQYYGMSELTTKKIASEFQAMGNAMGITNKQVQDSNKSWQAVNETLQATGQGYNNTAESMADMSLNLTKLAADMGSFFNQEYEEVGERLASGIFTGQTRVLSFSTYVQRCA